MYNADPANLTRPVPKVMRDAADLVRAHGAHLADRQDDLIARLEAPYAPRIQRAVRDLLNDDTETEREKASQPARARRSPRAGPPARSPAASAHRPRRHPPDLLDRHPPGMAGPVAAHSAGLAGLVRGGAGAESG